MSPHNHGFTISGSHPSLRKIVMSPEFQDSIVNQTRSGAKPREIISSLRLDHDEEYPIFKSRDVYNVKAKATS